MRILHVIPTYLPALRYGGPMISVHGLCRALALRGHDVSVVTTNVDGEGTLDLPAGKPVDREGVTVWYFPSKYFRRIYYSPAMKQFLEDEIAGFDAVHLHSVYLWPTWAAARAAKRAGRKYIISPRGMLSPEAVRAHRMLIKRLWISLIERQNLENAVALHATSRMEAEDLRSYGYQLPEIRVIPNGIEEEWFSETPGEPLSGESVILCLGRISWKKQLDQLIRMLPLVPGSRLVLAGNDEENLQGKLTRLAEQLGVIDRVSFPGMITGNEKKKLYRSASVFVLPSLSENFANVVLEAMSTACPVIVSPGVGMADIVLASGGGYVLPPEPESMATAINRILSDSVLRRELGSRGRAYAEKYLRWEGIAKGFEDLYLEKCSLI